MINIEDYMPMIHRITNKRFEQFGFKYEYEDLFQIGCLGFMVATKRYDRTKNTKFSSYAYEFIDGYITNFIRGDRWFLAKNGQERITTKSPLSLDSSLNNSDDKENNRSYLDKLSDTVDAFKYTELNILLNNLPDTLKKVIKLKYFKGLMQREIAQILGIKQVTVSKYEKKALGILRKEMVI